MKLKKIAAMLTVAGLAAPAFATNGMNMEGYGPIATGMGGASMAYDNGTAGLINNPATLGLMKSGTSRLDVAIGGLHPTVDSGMRGTPGVGSTNSDGTSYFMPAIGYVRKDGGLTWGVGMMSQGGMGTEYGTNSFLNSGRDSLFNAIQTTSTGLENRSELGIGRVMIPLVFDVSDSFRIGGTVDYLWGGLDFASVLPGATFAAMAANSNLDGTSINKRRYGSVSVGSTGVATLLAMTNGGIFDYAHIGANEGTNKFSQRLTTNGTGFNVGAQWDVNKSWSVGAVYHAKTNLKDMSGSATMTVDDTAAIAGYNAAGAAGMLPPGFPVALAGIGRMPIRGTLKVIDFQWPETYGLGVSYKSADGKWMLAGDYKMIGWANVMQAFRMRFESAAGPMEFRINQNWEDQNVFQLGGSYKLDDQMTLRAGLSVANNPVPDANVHPLFPAITENHFTVGMGYALSKSSGVDFSLAYAPQVSVTAAAQTNAALNFAGQSTVDSVEATHSQLNWQLMYSNKF